MSALVLYFTGTGNSLHAANKIAKKLDSAEVRPLAPLAVGDGIDIIANTVVFVFPVYSMGFPDVVSRAVNNINLVGADYVVAVANCDSAAGCALGLFDDELKKSSGRGLDAGWVLFMPGNYTPLYGSENRDRTNAKLRRADDRLDLIGSAIAEQRKSVIESFPQPLKAVAKLSWKIFKMNAGRCGRRFRASSDCTGCGLCARVCPVDNIVMDGSGRPKWLDKCEQCMACLQLCPVEAINCFWWTKGRRRYRHPDITEEKMLRQKNKWPVSR